MATAFKTGGRVIKQDDISISSRPPAVMHDKLKQSSHNSLVVYIQTNNVNYEKANFNDRRCADGIYGIIRPGQATCRSSLARPRCQIPRPHGRTKPRHPCKHQLPGQPPLPFAKQDTSYADKAAPPHVPTSIIKRA